MEKGMTPLYR